MSLRFALTFVSVIVQTIYVVTWPFVMVVYVVPWPFVMVVMSACFAVVEVARAVWAPIDAMAYEIASPRRSTPVLAVFDRWLKF